MLMVLFITVTPHHHHPGKICLDLDDAHAMHADAEGEESDFHCVAIEKYFPADELRVDCAAVAVAPVLAVVTPLSAARSAIVRAHTFVRVYISPPILSWRINC